MRGATDVAGAGRARDRRDAGRAGVALRVACTAAKSVAASRAAEAAGVVVATHAFVKRIDVRLVQRAARDAVVRAVDFVTVVDDNLGVVVLVDVGDDRALEPCAARAVRGEQDVAARAVVDAQEALVGVHGLRFAVAVEVEDRGAGLA